jgi:hypothetical protein
MGSLSIIYYTSNFLDTHNPYFLANTRKYLLEATRDLPIIIVSQQPTVFGGNSQNICLGDIGRSHLNIYKQMLIGAKAATTNYVAMAEDDIFYSYEHFHNEYIGKFPDMFLYDMNKVSLFTWTKPPIFSFRHNRKVVNQLIVRRELLIEALEERFARVTELLKTRPLEKIIKYWGDFSRYEDLLGVTIRKGKEFMCTKPSIVLSHEHAYGYLSQGKRKRLGDLRILEVQGWPRAEEMIKLFYER